MLRAVLLLLVPPTEPAAVAEALAWVLTHPTEAQAMGERGRQAVAEAYSWETEVARLLQLYERLASGTERTKARKPAPLTQL